MRFGFLPKSRWTVEDVKRAIIDPNKPVCGISTRMAKFILAFDKGEKVKPFRFVLPKKFKEWKDA